APVLDVWCTGQGTHPPRDTLAASLAVEPEQVRVRHPLVGGGFGGRGDALVEFLVAAHCARRLGRPVRWVQSRTEQFFALPYGRGQRHRIRLGLSADGDIVGLDATMWADAGAYPHMGPMLAAAGRRQCSGMYRVPRLRYRYGAAVTNAPPVGAYRGAGQPEVNAALERAVDAAARLAGLDPVEVRRRNLLTPDDLPYDTGLGITIDSGDPVAALDAALDAVDAPRRRVEAAARRAAGAARVVGIGVGCYSQTAGSGDDPDFARLDLDADGTVHVSCSSSAHGQGHHSMWARLASAELGIAAGSVRVTDSDSAATRFGVSTGGSRST
ncbi:MAG TPA: carbon monoxide dehydrogenase, partial [Acidimicrobiaceae bacterium]|nr:carbon monoxide dehydrogenase [Acidimicrobiaceae bacterium]